MTKRIAGKTIDPRTEMRSPQSGRSPASKLFLGFLGSVAVAYLAIITYHTSVPRNPTQVGDSLSYLDRCRELCEQYGLLPTGDIAVDAKAYLVAARAQSPPPQGLKENRPAMGQAHPLVGKTAPDFELPDDQGRKWALRDMCHDGPVIVVFYYGYFCSHCVAQLFGLEDDLAKFTRHGVRIVALSADPPSDTAARFRQYGRFHFPVLSDHDYHIAERYGVYSPATASRDEDLKHGTFLVNQKGRIAWAYVGNLPFLDNKLLLDMTATNRTR
ncbi:MAG TPA: redoxin domain-containing protein [Planctomycetaceae bacterium]|nr:redoxin domain-containing protein [Planctomycetaceae bacterium]